MAKAQIICRAAPDYDKTLNRHPDREPCWIVVVKRDGKLVVSRLFKGEFPKRDARTFAAKLKLREVKA